MFKLSDNELDINLDNKHYLVIQRRYEAFSALNDFFIAMWFLMGSIMLLDKSLMDSGTWLFIIGSVQFLIRPMIKLTSLVHLSRTSQNK